MKMITNRLEPHFNNRGFFYPQGMEVVAAVPTPFDGIFGMMFGQTIWPHGNCAKHGYCLKGWLNCEVGPPRVQVRVDLPRDYFAGTLVHELCHAVLDRDEAHGPQFEALARTFGLEGPCEHTQHGADAVALLRSLDGYDAWPLAPAPEWEIPEYVLKAML